MTLCRLTLHVGLGTFRPIDGRVAGRAPDALRMGVHHAGDGRSDRTRAGERGGRVVAVGTTSVRVLETAAADGALKPFAGQTDLFIRPPYQFRAVDALLTNFHLPRTTLLVLVRTFGGDDLIRRAYEEAIREEYRFYSYGDAMLISAEHCRNVLDLPISSYCSLKELRKDSPCPKCRRMRGGSRPSCFTALGYFQGFSGDVDRYLRELLDRPSTPAIGRARGRRRTPASSS